MKLKIFLQLVQNHMNPLKAMHYVESNQLIYILNQFDFA